MWSCQGFSLNPVLWDGEMCRFCCRLQAPHEVKYTRTAGADQIFFELTWLQIDFLKFFAEQSKLNFCRQAKLREPNLAVRMRDAAANSCDYKSQQKTLLWSTPNFFVAHLVHLKEIQPKLCLLVHRSPFFMPLYIETDEHHSTMSSRKACANEERRLWPFTVGTLHSELCKSLNEFSLAKRYGRNCVKAYFVKKRKFVGKEWNLLVRLNLR